MMTLYIKNDDHFKYMLVMKIFDEFQLYIIKNSRNYYDSRFDTVKFNLVVFRLFQVIETYHFSFNATN